MFVSLRAVGLEQTRTGLAWWYREYAHEQATQERLVYRDEEDAAKAARRGLWKDPKAIPPWAWRKGREGEVLVVGREAANSRCITTLPGALVQRRYGACRSSADDLPRQRTPPTCPAREGSWP